MKKLLLSLKIAYKSVKTLGFVEGIKYCKGFFIPLGILVLMFINIIMSIIFPMEAFWKVIIFLFFVSFFVASLWLFKFWRVIFGFLLGILFGIVIFTTCLVIVFYHSWIIPYWIILFVIAGVIGYFFVVFMEMEYVFIHIATILTASYVALIMEVKDTDIIIAVTGFIIGISLEIIFLEKDEFKRMIKLGFMSKRHKAGGKKIIDFTN